MTANTNREGSRAPASDAAPWPDGIAIVGMSARFPGSRNVDEYWQHLLAGDLLISDLSPEDLLAAGVDAQTFDRRDYVRKGSSIADAESFDPELFGFSRREAEFTDPQQRVLLECAWEALEHAGYLGAETRTGVFAGVGLNSYLMQLISGGGIAADAGGYQLMLGNDKDFLATRIAYKLNLKGPALTVQLACSTSLAAVHLACHSILRGECAMALAGGVSIAFPQMSGYPYMPGMILSPDGFCRPFDAGARGTVPGRGAGLVVLKRLAEAVADRDTIYAVVRGSAWNNDGADKVGYTVPSVEGQAAVIRQALAAADAPASRIGFIEAHGTATELGDPIEFTALRAVFDQATPHQDSQPGSCLLGAVKSNMGHSDVAAGIAGLLKASLAVYSGQVPPTLHFNRPNPYLGFEGGPFIINTATAPWPRAGERWAGVSSFGIGGTNVHAVISEAPAVPPTTEDNLPRIFPVSARTPAALQASCDQLRDQLLANPRLNHADIASTLQQGRRHLAARRAVVAASTLELAELLQSPPKKRQPGDSSLAREVVFLFPGQGQQFHGMAQSLYRADAIFRQTIDEGAAVLRGECEADLVEIITGSSESDPPRITDTSVAQPLLFLTEYALARRWISLGVEPSALLGHSLGELVAATVAGVFSFEDGLRLAARRGQIMSSTGSGMRPGLMLAVTLPPEKLANYLDRDLWLAAENGPAMSVASGLVEAIEVLERRLAAARIACVRLDSQNAFHTPLMAEAAQAFRHEVESVTRRAPAIPWLSNVTGTWVDSAEAQSPQYWGTQILSRVRFMQNLAALADRPRLLLEVGPGEALTGIARRQLPASAVCASLGSKNRRQSDHLVFLNAAATMWERGVDLDWPALSPSSGRRIPLPTYPFERQRCFIEPSQNPAERAPQPPEFSAKPEPPTTPTKRADLASWFYTPSWQSTPPASIALTQKAALIDCWLVLTDRPGLGDAIAERLRQTGATVLTAAAADAFHAGEDHFELNPAEAQHYLAMWQEITGRGLRPTGLIDLWTLRGMNLSAYDTLALTLQAAGRLRHSFRQIEIVTDHLQSPTGGQAYEIERAEILGLASAIPAEYPGTEVRSIDVDLSPESIESTAVQIMAEIAFFGPRLKVAYRNGQRWNQLWTPAPLQQVFSEPFRDGGVYVITGGMGGIGFVLARHLMQQHEARVALIGRTPLPPADEQQAWLAQHGSDNPVSRRISRLRELQAAPGEVLLLTADVEDSSALGHALDQARERFGAINGVVHAAGLAAGGMIASQGLDHAAATRAPKVKGSIVLAELLRRDKLDFFLLTSSISALVPAVSQAAYAGANAFQDHFAGYCRSTLNLPAVAINLDAWQDFGMAAEVVLPEGFDAHKEQRLSNAMTPEEGIEAIRRVAALWTSSRILVSTLPFESLLNPVSLFEPPQPGIVASPFGEATGYASGPAQDAPAAGEELAIILAIWKELLAAEDIQPEDNFFQLGGHSLMGTMLILRIRDRFDVVLTLRMIFENPTPRGIANIVSTLREALHRAPVLQGEREEFEF